MHDLHQYLDLFADTDTVGAQLLARAVYAARHGDDDAGPDDLRPLVRRLPESTPADLARQRLLVEAACAALATDDGRDRGRQALAEELDVHRNTVDSWLRGEHPLQGPARKMVEKMVEVE